ncbi:hypothetical protein V5E97_17685 [Singulisphaera sp. Ch08]|uniref:ABC transporter permease n=1 Tax=Singulisphaera sp. Ch08 TaxID=3120278 RepID=A0AAU7CRF4_9BACT
MVTASAAFAGEREAGTLGLLDALPVDRKVLWLGKTTFALASTLGLSLIMLILGYLGSTDLQDLPGKSEFIGHYGTLLFESVAWGLFWSSLVGNPMVAGALALFCVGEVSYIASGGAKIEFISDSVIPARVVMGALALAASAVATVWRPRVGWTSPHSASKETAELATNRATTLLPRPASPTKVLMWKARRECFWIWLGASVICWGILALWQMSYRSVEGELAAALVGVGAAFLAGVAVFGGETAAGSHRFLLHLGVSPGPIWSKTMRVWGNGLAVTALIMLAILSIRWPGWWNRLDSLRFFAQEHRFLPIGILAAIASVFAVVSPFANAFAIGALAGMVFRRRITAGMIAVLIWVSIVPLQVSLAILGLIPHWGLLLTPMTILGISRAWAGDWLDDRTGPARWLRLVGYLAVPLVVFPVAYIAYRAWGVPDPGPVLVATRMPAESAPPGSDTTAATYRRLDKEILALGGADSPAAYRRLGKEILAVGGTAGKDAGAIGRPALNFDLFETALKEHRDLIDQLHKATELPPPKSVIQPLFLVGAIPDSTSEEMIRLAWLLEQHGRGLLKRHDLPGAWEDILAQYRIARQLTGLLPTSFTTHNALVVDRQATRLALDWAVSDKQSPDLLRKALADLRALPAFPTLGDVLKAEASMVERALDLSGAELETAINGPHARSLPMRVFENLLLYSSWERERARRVCRAEFKRLIAESADESKPLSDINASPRSQEIRQASPLAATILSYGWLSASLNRAMAGRRGLAQVIALRAWHYEHNGAYPKSLDVLVPGLLDHLPLDPYTARPFVYRQSTGHHVATLDLQSPRPGVGPMTKPGQWLLISVGPDRREEAAVGVGGRRGVDDLVFPLPYP